MYRQFQNHNLFLCYFYIYSSFYQKINKSLLPTNNLKALDASAYGKSYTGAQHLCAGDLCYQSNKIKSAEKKQKSERRWKISSNTGTVVNLHTYFIRKKKNKGLQHQDIWCQLCWIIISYHNQGTENVPSWWCSRV